MPASGSNPYTRPGEPRPGAAPDPSGKFRWGGPGRYSVPDIPDSTDPEYLEGYSPALASAGAYDGTLVGDNIRTGQRKPPPNDSNNKEYRDKQYQEFKYRHSVEELTLGNWPEQQVRPYTPKIPDQVDEKAPIRPTATMAPVDNLMRRPWNIPRNAADAIGPNVELHLSMADHRRAYDIYMMQPRGGIGVNTIRSTPQPWDANLYVAPEASNEHNAGVFGGGNRRFGL